MLPFCSFYLCFSCLVSLTDLNHETKNHAYEAISISIVQPEVLSLVIKEEKMSEKD